MKLIIDIPKRIYDVIKIRSAVMTSELHQAVLNGIPIEDIKTEITNIPITDTDGHNNNWYREPQAIIDDALRIIDKHIKEKNGSR